VCGKTDDFTMDQSQQNNMEPQIRSGKIVPPGKFPWHAVIYVHDVQICGGSLIKENVSFICFWIPPPDYFRTFSVLDRIGHATMQSRSAGVN